jgi:hypothetical protein
MRARKHRGHQRPERQPTRAAIAPGQPVIDSHQSSAGGPHSDPDQRQRENQSGPVGIDAASQNCVDDHIAGAGGTSFDPDHRADENQLADVGIDAPGQECGENQSYLAGRTLSDRDQLSLENQLTNVAIGAPGHKPGDNQASVAGGALSLLIDSIKQLHRRRRFAMKRQQQSDRALESYIRCEFTKWSPELPEKERETFNRETKAIIKAARKGKGDEQAVTIVTGSDASRQPMDAIRNEAEKRMVKMACELPVWPWVKAQRGAGALGLATIIAETGDLSNYPNWKHVWSRLGFAPYDGCAGSTWKRDTWRPRADERRVDRSSVFRRTVQPAP